MQTAFALMDLPQQKHLTIRTFQPGDEAAFLALNEAWISTLFRMEEHDYEMLRQPYAHILGPGGQIIVAVEDGVTVGCVALIPLGAGVFELAKMAVDESQRGRGLGRRILSAAIEVARNELGATKLYLESSSKLKNAVHLYESLGFRHLAEEERPQSAYVRADVFMDLEL